MAATPVSLDYIFSSRVDYSPGFGFEIYQTVFRIPIPRPPLTYSRLPKQAPCHGHRLTSEWMHWVDNHPGFTSPENQTAEAQMLLRQRLLREILWPAFASHMMDRSRRPEPLDPFCAYNMLGMLNWYRRLSGMLQQDYVEPDGFLSDGMWWFMLADSPWAEHSSLDEVMYEQELSEPGPDVGGVPCGLGFAPENTTCWRTAFWGMNFPIKPGLERLALDKLAALMRESASNYDGDTKNAHWQRARPQYIWIKYWGPGGYSGSLKSLLAQRQKYFRIIRSAFNV